MLDKIGFYIKAALTSLFTAVTMHFGILGDLLWLFIAAVTIDYITGIMAAIYNKELSSGAGFRGIIKKVGKCFIIAVALLSDEVVAQSANQLGVGLSTGGAIASIVTIWLILNELISILENLAKINIALPSFLLKAIKLLQKQADAKGGGLAPEATESPAD